jgi:adenine-specific DNA-methyltransferase
MRFIGSKANLLKQIEQIIAANAQGGERVFCDIFAGTGAVSNYFKPKYQVISNDLLHFSYVIQKAVIENNRKPDFQKLAAAGISDPFSFLEETELKPDFVSDGKHFITENYSPHLGCRRMYLSERNALRIDFIRTTVEDWKSRGLLDGSEYYYLLACLLEGVPFVSNITGTYGAYLKQWDKRARNPFELRRPNVIDNGRRNQSFREDANRLIASLEGDILYLDPPYNSRQYVPNYHLLETISLYDHPKIRGVTGIRPYEGQKSAYCNRNEVAEAFEDLISKAKFSHIVLSYSTDGLMTRERIEAILKKYGQEKSFRVKVIPYRKYKSKAPSRKKQVNELLFYIHRELPGKRSFPVPGGKRSGSPAKNVSARKYLKSPLNYIGGKYRLLPQLLPHFPKDADTFVDLFCGGANVAVNVPARHTVCNDMNTKIIELFQTFQQQDIDGILNHIAARIAEFHLTRENEQGYLDFRRFYNRTQDPLDLYTLTCYSFNYQFRFNNRLEYNNPFGRNRSRFSDAMRQNLIAFVEKLQGMDIRFQAGDFTKFDPSSLTPADFVYCDPPYLITTGSYNDGNRGFQNWKEAEELALYEFLDRLNQAGVRFALSNVLEHKGKVNKPLIAWSRKYDVIPLTSDYSNANYHTRKGGSREVLIVNYRSAGR